VDPVDFEILAALERAPRVSYAELGSTVGLSANAVKARVHRMLGDGVLQGFAALPRASLLGLQEGLLLFSGADDVDAREEEILRGLAELPGVRFTDVGLDHTVYVWILYRDDADWERIERAAISLVGKPPSTLLRAPPSPGAPHALAPADWKIVRALQSDGRAHAKDLTGRAGLSFKPLKRRLDAMLRAGDVRVVPIVSPAESAGRVLFRVICFLASDEVKVPALPGSIAQTEAPGVVSVLAQRATLRDARAMQRQLAALPGVERALLQIGTRRASLGWLDEALARQLAQPAPALAATERAADAAASSAPVPMPRQRS